MKKLILTTGLLFCVWLGYSQVPAITLTDTVFTTAAGQKLQAQMGQLMVPENRSNPQSVSIPVYFIKLHSTAAIPGTPLFYLEGGPGSSCTWQAGNPEYLERWASLLDLGDVILLDQRGTGAGQERVLYITDKDVPTDILANDEARAKHMRQMEKKALATFKANGVDLNGYTTKENAADVDQLRRALGYKKINLMGFSYGTHLAQAYIRYYESNVENTVLLGTEGPDHTYKLPSTIDVHFKRLAQMVAADPVVGATVPDLVALYQKVMRKLKQQPAEVTVSSPFTGEAMKVQVGPYGLQMIMAIDIGDASDLPAFPRLLYTIDQEDYRMLEWFIRKRWTGAYGIQAMSATMDAASGASPTRLTQIEEEQKTTLFPDALNFDPDSKWPHPDLGASFRAPLTSSIRTLFMSGSLDYNTPPFQAEEVRWGFANSFHITVGNAGHEQIISHPGTLPAIHRFLQGQSVKDITLNHPPLQFIPVTGQPMPGQYHPSIPEE